MSIPLSPRLDHVATELQAELEEVLAEKECIDLRKLEIDQRVDALTHALREIHSLTGLPGEKPPLPELLDSLPAKVEAVMRRNPHAWWSPTEIRLALEKKGQLKRANGETYVSPAAVLCQVLYRLADRGVLDRQTSKGRQSYRWKGEPRRPPAPIIWPANTRPETMRPANSRSVDKNGRAASRP